MKSVLALFSLFLVLIMSSCGQSGGTAPNPNPTPAASPSSPSTPTVTCDSGGAAVGGYCWYYAADNTSCTTTCSGHGGYNAATLTYAGTSGTTANCDAVMTAIGAPGAGTSSTGCGLGVGCVYDVATPARFICTGTATNAADAYAGGRRACACNQ